MIFLCSCNPVYYIPTTQNVSLIHQKGQIKLAIAANSDQIDVNGAYGIMKGLGFQLNGSLVFPKEEKKGNGGSGNLFEAGLGYYYNISPSFLFDTYALVGFGNMENHFIYDQSSNTNLGGDLSAKLLRIGIQPGISYHEKYGSISGTVRISNLEYSAIKGDLEYNGDDQLSYLNKNKSNIIVEPAITLRGGLENIKLQMQALVSVNTCNRGFYQQKITLSMGLSYQFR